MRNAAVKEGGGRAKEKNGVWPDVLKTVYRGIEVVSLKTNKNSLFDRRNRYYTRTSELIYIHISRRRLGVIQRQGKLRRSISCMR